MFGKRVMAIILCSGGLGSLLVAATSAVEAQCTPQLWQPAICHPAHEAEPSFPSGGDCVAGGGGSCSPTSGTRCVATFGTAIAGECEHFIDYSNLTKCTKDAGLTVVIVNYYDAACSTASGECACEFTINMSGGTAQLQVCNCTESAY